MFFHPLYRRGYLLLLPLQITACLADLNVAIKPFPSFCLRHYCAERKHPVSLPTEVAVAPFTFPFPSTAVVVTEALSGVSASPLLTENTHGLTLNPSSTIAHCSRALITTQFSTHGFLVDDSAEEMTAGHGLRSVHHSQPASQSASQPASQLSTPLSD